MQLRRLRLEHIGQLEQADIEFGDLTVFVGPQATGKSIVLQFLELVVDTGAVLDRLYQYGLSWEKNIEKFLDVYMGEGMRRLWKERASTLVADGHPVDLARLVGRRKRDKTESLFFIPAQRVLTLGRAGWPRPFADYSPGDPFVVRDFSEKLRSLMEADLGRNQAIFPQPGRIKVEIRTLLERDLFAGLGLAVDIHGAQKRLVLRAEGSDAPLPFMVWSAGQREFVPLLLGLYWLLPRTKVSRRNQLEWVIIEELEMGLHPKAISDLLLLVVDLLWRGYRVCLSTHSPHVLDLVWALGMFQKHRARPEKLLELFDVSPTPNMKKMAREVIGKQARVYFFDRETGLTRDISNLDPGADDAIEAGWGGLSGGRVADVVAEVIRESPEV